MLVYVCQTTWKTQNVNTHVSEILQSDAACSLPSLPPYPSCYVKCCYSVVPAAAVVKPPELQPLMYGAADIGYSLVFLPSN